MYNKENVNVNVYNNNIIIYNVLKKQTFKHFKAKIKLCLVPVNSSTPIFPQIEILYSNDKYIQSTKSYTIKY